MMTDLHFGRMAASIGVTDMTRAVQFYSDVLGFGVAFQNGNPVLLTILERDAAELHLLYAPGWQGPNFNVAHLLVNGVDSLYRHCQAHGVTIIKTIADKDYGMRAFVLADPDGNRIDIGEAA